MKISTFFYIPFMLLCFTFTGPVKGHSFSTSFLTISGDGGVKYQLSFHDFAALNANWIKEGKISKQLLNSELGKLERFLNQTVSFNQCYLALKQKEPWATVTYAKERYILLQAITDCVQPLTSVTVNNVWAEFPDHRVVVESSLKDSDGEAIVLDSDKRTVTF